MKYIVLALLLGAVALASAEEDCFDKAKSEQDWREAKVECLKNFAHDEEHRIMKVAGCILRKKGIISADGVLDYEGKYKPAYDEYAARDLTHVKEEMDKCWESSNHDTKLFFGCWIDKLHALCPDSKKWAEEDDHDH